LQSRHSAIRDRPPAHFALVILEKRGWGLMNYLSGLMSNHSPPDLSFQVIRLKCRLIKLYVQFFNFLECLLSKSFHFLNLNSLKQLGMHVCVCVCVWLGTVGKLGAAFPILSPKLAYLTLRSWLWCPWVLETPKATSPSLRERNPPQIFEGPQTFCPRSTADTWESEIWKGSGHLPRESFTTAGFSAVWAQSICSQKPLTHCPALSSEWQEVLTTAPLERSPHRCDSVVCARGSVMGHTDSHPVLLLKGPLGCHQSQWTFFCMWSLPRETMEIRMPDTTLSHSAVFVDIWSKTRLGLFCQSKENIGNLGWI
jgi:hypothetical protein